jgi:uncharacterized protein YndB with AHSA1/START domain
MDDHPRTSHALKKRINMSIQTYRIYIKATPQAVWDALTKPEWSIKYGYAPLVDYDLDASTFRAYRTRG